MKNLFIKAKYLIWAFKRRNEIHLGDQVNYQGEICSVINGVHRPYWKLLPMNKANLEKDVRETMEVHENKFLLITSFRRTIQVIKQDYQFQMNYWYMIDQRKPFYSGRISYLRSSDIKY